MTADDAVVAVTEQIIGVDRATFGCHVYAGFCTLDTVIAGNWVQFNAQAAGIGTTDEVRDQLIEITERAVTRFSS